MRVIKLTYYLSETASVSTTTTTTVTTTKADPHAQYHKCLQNLDQGICRNQKLEQIQNENMLIRIVKHSRLEIYPRE